MNAQRAQLVAEPGRQEVVLTRTFDAPRELVFRMMTDPEQIPNWWGPADAPTTVEQMDVRFGGAWRFVSRDSSGAEAAFRGVYHVVQPAERLVYTFEFEGMPGHVLMETIDLYDEDGKTRVVDTSVFQTVDDRDGMVQSGMESGATESMERLAVLLGKAK